MSRSTDAPHADGLETDEAEAAPKPRARLRRRLVKLVLIALLLYVGWCVLLFFTQHWLIFPEYALAPPGPQDKYDDSTIVLTREIDDGRVIAWFVPAPGADAAHPAPLVVYIHGAGNIIDTRDSVRFEYRGAALAEIPKSLFVNLRDILRDIS